MARRRSIHRQSEEHCQDACELLFSADVSSVTAYSVLALLNAASAEHNELQQWRTPHQAM